MTGAGADVVGGTGAGLVGGTGAGLVYTFVLICLMMVSNFISSSTMCVLLPIIILPTTVAVCSCILLTSSIVLAWSVFMLVVLLFILDIPSSILVADNPF